MFSKVSRYRNVPVVTALDAQGRTLTTTDIRLLPDVTGIFEHTVGAGDRLDQLGNQFYSQPLQWWSICDANPRFLSPLEMLGEDAITTTSFPVSVTGTPPWGTLLANVGAVVGVEDVTVSEKSILTPHSVTATIITYVEQVSRTVVVRYNRLNVTAAELATAIAAAGFRVAPFADLGQIGRRIAIPPKPIG